MYRATLAIAVVLLPRLGLTDEGMWTVDNFPAERVAEKYKVNIDNRWLRAAQRATVRLEQGCTGSFASPDGLVLTNNHCVWDCIQDLSSDERNLSDLGFLAAERGQELRCAGQQVSVLIDFENVSSKVARAVAGLPATAANDKRKAELTNLEAGCEQASGQKLKCEAVSLYHGGQYFLYKYKRYDDVRLVFAPELDSSAFGGDPDNFNFPRWSFDMSFLRVYEDGAPASTPDYLRWRETGPQAGDPVFVAGHPGSTERQLTTTQLKLLRSVVYPLWLLRYSELRGRMLVWAATSDAAARTVQQRLPGLENGIKVRRNQLKALQDDELMARKAADENALREAVNADPELRAAYGEAWDLIDAAVQAHENMFEEHLFIELAAGLGADLFDYARTIVRGTAERERPNEERLRDYTDAALPAVQQRLLADSPVDKEFQKLWMTFSLDKMREWLGPDSRFVRLVLGSESPEAYAGRVVDGTKLADVKLREALWQGGVEAVRASDDPLIQLALRVEPDARALRKRYDDEVEAPRIHGEAMISDARFRLYGTETYPDATFTLRVSYGAVEGWLEKGSMLRPFTDTRGLYNRATGVRPFMQPDSWLRAREQLEPDTRFNFSASTDITGGNSGSPILAADGALVGLAFDGNIHSIAGDFWYDQSNNRTVGVNAAIMLEALRKVYGADQLLKELTLVE